MSAEASFHVVKNTKPVTVKVYHPDGSIVNHKVSTKYIELGQLKELIGGGHIETFPATNNKYVLVFDEEGKLKGMHPNEKGSLLAGRTDSFLCGPVLYCPVKLLEDD